MSTKTKLYTLLAGLLFTGSVAYSQQPRLLELPRNNFLTAPITGNGYGPRTTNHVITFDRDINNNNAYDDQFSGPGPIVGPAITATVSFPVQQYSEGNPLYPFLPYGNGTTNPTGTSNAIRNGLTFGAGPTSGNDFPVGSPEGQQATPISSYNLLAAFNGGGGPRNGMFMSDPAATPVANFPGGVGTGIDAEGLLPPPATHSNGAVAVFTCAQIMYDLGAAHNTATRHYMGDIVIQFSRFVNKPVIHIAGLGGSYRYIPTATPPLGPDTSNYQSTYFTTELELVGAPFTLTKMAGNEFMTVSGKNILNNCHRPNGASFFSAGTSTTHHNFGAASGSVRVDGPATIAVRFRVYLRGADVSQFAWSAAQSAVQGALRPPLTGDIWYISATVKQQELIPLPARGMRLNGALNGNDVLLTWKTLSEIDTKEFEIERSSDGVNFSVIGTKAAAGNSAVELNYTHTDVNMQAPVYYYRLKLVDNDNEFSYSNVVVVRKASIKGVKVFPNPAVNEMNVEFSNAKGNYTISLFNQAGQELTAQRAVINYAVQYIKVDRKGLPAGSYVMKVKNTESGEVYNEKIILQ